MKEMWLLCWKGHLHGEITWKGQLVKDRLWGHMEKREKLGQPRILTEASTANPPAEFSHTRDPGMTNRRTPQLSTVYVTGFWEIKCDFKLLSLGVVCCIAIVNWNKCKVIGFRLQLLNEWVFPNPIFQSHDDNTMNSAFDVFHHQGKRKACCEILKSSWNWLICFIRAIMLIIIWTKNPGTMWLLDMKWHFINSNFISHPQMHSHPVRTASCVGSFNAGNVIWKKIAAWPWNCRFAN
jgi:hypothetical protein